MRLRDRTAVITGAASGIGRALAINLSARGTHLALADVNGGGLAETARLCATGGLRVTTHQLDVADAGAVANLPDAVRRDHPAVDLLINNAGVALTGTFEQVSAGDFEWLFATNFWGVVRMTRAFLPLLRASDDARIVNLSSLFGLIAPPGQTAYVASKFAVRGFSLSLAAELKGTSVGVTVVHPGGIATAIARNARVGAGVPVETLPQHERMWRKLLRMPPENAAAVIVEAVERRRKRVIIGNEAKVAALAERIAPVSYGRLLRLLSRTR